MMNVLLFRLATSCTLAACHGGVLSLLQDANALQFALVYDMKSILQK